MSDRILTATLGTLLVAATTAVLAGSGVARDIALAVAEAAAVVGFVAVVFGRYRPAARWQRALAAVDREPALLRRLDRQARALSMCVPEADGVAVLVTTGQDELEIVGSVGDAPVRHGDVMATANPDVVGATRGEFVTSIASSAIESWCPLRGDGSGYITVVGLAHSARRVGALVAFTIDAPTARLTRRLRQVAEAAAPDIERARLDDAERRSRLDAYQTRQHMAMLVTASGVLQRAFEDFTPAFDALAAEVVPAYGDFLAIDLVERSIIKRTAAAHATRALLQRVTDASAAVILEVVDTGRTAVFPDPSAPDNARAALAELGLDSWAVIPLRAQERVVGTLTVGTTNPRRGLRRSDVAVFEELALRVGLAVERVLMYRESQEAARSAIANEHRLQTLIDASPLAIVELDATGVVQNSNAAATALLGVSLHAQTVGALLETRDRLLAGAIVIDHRDRLVRGDGTPVEVGLSAAIVADGESTGVLCVITDVTERQLLERELQQRQRMEALGRLAGAIAHDFNNLLTVIVGYGDLLSAQLGENHPMVGDVNAIREAGKRAATFTEQLLTISRRRVVEPTVIDLTSTVRALGEVLQRLVGDDIVVETDLDPDAGRIRIDVGQLEQVLLNLVVNARDSMPSGGRLVIGTSRQDSEGPWAVLSVRDTGVGMDAATIERCFEPFFTTGERRKSSGLGLATVYGIVTQAGGRISVESEPGDGTTVSIELVAVDEPVATRDERPVDGDGDRDHGVVLLVEDDADVRGFAEAVLRNAGFDVWGAASGDEALRMSADASWAADVLVTDVVMPGMSGAELATRLTHDQPNMPVLFISGYADDLLDRRFEHAVSRFLAKPFEPGDLVRSVRAILREARSRSGTQRLSRS